MYKWLGVRFANYILFSLNNPWKWNNLVSLRSDYFIFIGYLKTGGREGGSSEPLEPPLDLPLSFYHELTQHYQSLQQYMAGLRSAVVACLTRDTGGAALCLWARRFILCLALVQHRKTRPDMTEKLLTGT